MDSIGVILERISRVQTDISAIQQHLAVINDHSGDTALELAKFSARLDVLTVRLDVIEKFLWMIIGVSVAAVAGAFWSLILHKRNGKDNH